MVVVAVVVVVVLLSLPARLLAKRNALFMAFTIFAGARCCFDCDETAPKVLLLHLKTSCLKKGLRFRGSSKSLALPVSISFSMFFPSGSHYPNIIPHIALYSPYYVQNNPLYPQPI